MFAADAAATNMLSRFLFGIRCFGVVLAFVGELDGTDGQNLEHSKVGIPSNGGAIGSPKNAVLHRPSLWHFKQQQFRGPVGGSDARQDDSAYSTAFKSIAVNLRKQISCKVDTRGRIDPERRSRCNLVR